MDYTYIKNASNEYGFSAKITTDDGLVIEFQYHNGSVSELLINGDDFDATNDMFASLYAVIKGEFKSIRSVISEVNIVYQDIKEEYERYCAKADAEESEYRDTANFYFNQGKI